MAQQRINRSEGRPHEDGDQEGGKPALEQMKEAEQTDKREGRDEPPAGSQRSDDSPWMGGG